MDILAIHLVKADDVEDSSPLLLDAVEMDVKTKGKTDKTFIRTAGRNAAYVAKVLGNRLITSYATPEAAKSRDWCFEQGMSLNTVKRVFTSLVSKMDFPSQEMSDECDAVLLKLYNERNKDFALLSESLGALPIKAKRKALKRLLIKEFAHFKKMKTRPK